MIEMGGNCKTPMAALCTTDNSNLQLRAAFAVPDGRHIFMDEMSEDQDKAHDLGVKVAQNIKSQMMKSQYFELVRDLFEVD